MGRNKNKASPAIWVCARDIYKPSCEDEKFLAQKNNSGLKKTIGYFRVKGSKKI